MLNRQSIADTIECRRSSVFYRVLTLLIAVTLVSGCSVLNRKSELLDTDQDGVADSSDRCGGTIAGNPVDSDGCEIFSGTIENVDFPPGEHALNTAARQSLDTLIKKLEQYPTVVLAVDGHTDNRGSARANLALSKKRVMSVVRYLVVKGVDGRRLRPHGYGESRPIMGNATEEGRQRNRRIELTVIKDNLITEP